MDAGAQGFGPFSSVFPGALAGSWVASKELGQKLMLIRYASTTDDTLATSGWILIVIILYVFCFFLAYLGAGVILVFFWLLVPSLGGAPRGHDPALFEGLPQDCAAQQGSCSETRMWSSYLGV